MEKIIVNKISFTYELITGIAASIMSLIGAAILESINIQYAIILLGLAFLSIIIVILDYMRTRIGLKPKQYTKEADILVVAVGKKDLITEDMVKDNAVIIDVGINRVNKKLYGDVDFENVSKKCSYITPVPGGVGPMTVAMIGKNLLKSYELKKNKKKVRSLKK